jgi:L-threonylcarbamoyladenylate synthase
VWRRAALHQAAVAIHAGGIVAYPTEAVYGLGCSPANALAVRRLCELKQRSPRAGLILLAADLEQLPGWIDPDETELRALLSETAVPTTWIIQAGPLAADWITGGRRTVAVRLSRHELAGALCREAGGPLVSTSANRRGRPPARTALAVRSAFGSDVDCVLGGPTGRWARPSEIRVASTGERLRLA